MKSRAFALSVALFLVLLSIPAAVSAHGLGITHVRSLNFGYMRGAPGTYSPWKTGLVIFKADRPVKVTFTAEPFRYVGEDSTEGGTLDVTYWVGHKRNAFKPGTALKLQFSQEQLEKAKGAMTLEVSGEVKIHEVHGQPAGHYEGSITVTITAA